ncbi:MAG: hypothetical protein NXH75_06410, partial [Halobacteriovoraceae bacterium]|nr:hypothetical protein [Halobacteriovoraceae bacterium]
MSKPQHSVNAYTEWGHLKEIVVGNCVHLTRENIDLSFKLFFAENLQDQLIENSIVLQERLIAQRMEDLDNLSKTLETEGIIVHRPKPIETVKPFATPEFSSHTTPCDNPRDQVLIWGNKIIETPPLLRTRYFENDLLKDLFLAYFRKGADWIVAPKPAMRDSSFDQGQKDDTEIEMLFDGAQCMRFGKDILMNVSTRNHELGFQWLSRLLKGKANIHKVEITDNHIDSMMMPLRPGLLLINPTSMKSKISKLPKALQKWETIEVPVLDKTPKGKDEVYLASANIYTNVLPLSEKKVLIFAQNVSQLDPLADKLTDKGLEVVPVQLRHS